MAKFVTDRRNPQTWTAVRDPEAPADAPDSDVDIIYVAPAMDFGTLSAVNNDSFEFRRGKKSTGKQKGRNVPNNDDVEMRVKSQEAALLVHNIMHWEGPSFRTHPCTPDNIRLLIPEDAHTQAVLDAINAINGSTRQQDSDDPKSAPQNGVTIWQENGNAQSQSLPPTGSWLAHTNG